MTATFITGALAPIAFAQEKWTFLPSPPLFPPALGDPREPRNALTIQLDRNRYEGEMGSALELVRFEAADGSHFAWGILGSGRILLEQYGATFPMLAGDWDAGMYLSATWGDLSQRLAFKHMSSHLGDSLQDEVLLGGLEPLFFSRESITWDGALRLWDDLRLRAGVGVWYNMDPVGDPWYASLGAEAFSPSATLLDHPLRGYLAGTLRWKGESGGTWNKTLELGAQWKLEEGSARALRLALIYQAGLSEFGQFHLTPDERLGLSLFFDP